MNTEHALAVINEQKIIEYLDITGTGSNLTDNEKRQFIEVAKGCNLNPFKREIYCLAYDTQDGRKLSIITGYEVYLKRAERTGMLDGWKVEVKGSRKDNTFRAILTIFRKDWDKPFIHEAYFVEYNQRKALWKTKPITMIKKVAIAQGFRMCFPDIFSGMPYTAEESGEDFRNITPEDSSDDVMQPKPESFEPVTDPDSPDYIPEDDYILKPEDFQIEDADNTPDYETPEDKHQTIGIPADEAKQSHIDMDFIHEVEARADEIRQFAEAHREYIRPDAYAALNDLDIRALKQDEPHLYLDSVSERLRNTVKLRIEQKKSKQTGTLENPEIF